MATTTLRKTPRTSINQALADVVNFAELLDRLGNIPPERIRLHPAPGTATENDVIRARGALDKRLCELIDGVLVEKTMGTKEAFLAALIVHYLWDHLEKQDLGIALGADGFVRLFPGRVRIPDACFISWDRLPRGELPAEAIAGIVPDFIIEVWSPSNTRKEMDLKLQDYFQSGAHLVWIIFPATQSAEVYTAPGQCKKAAKGEVLDAGPVLPGFKLSMKKLFSKGTKKKPRPST